MSAAGWNAAREGAPLRKHTLGGNRSAMQLGELLHERQAYPGALVRSSVSADDAMEALE